MPSRLSLRLTDMACVALSAAALAGCADGFMHDDLQGCPASEALETSYIQLSVGMAQPSLTKGEGNPTGGEGGDGYEHGQDNENKINSVALFLFQGDLSDANASAPVTLVEFSKDDEELDDGVAIEATNKDVRYSSGAKKVEIVGGEYHALAVCNPRSLDWAKTSGLTLGDALRRVETEAWEEEDGSYSDFLMSSRDDVTVNMHSTTEENPIEVSVDVQRMAARVDYTMGDEADGTTFIISDDAYAGSAVEITGATLINDLNSGSYLFRRVSEGEGNDVEYLGLETSDEDGISTNYVIDPWTEGKDGTAVSAIEGLGYGVYYPGYAQVSAPDGENQQNPSYWSDLITPYEDAEDMDDWKLIGYTMENTTFSQYTSKRYCTGVVFSAVFTPSSVTSSFDADYDYETQGGGTFFKWNETLYATVEDIMMAAYPAGNTPEFTTDRFEEVIDECSTWSDVESFAESLRTDDPTGYKAFLLDETSDKEDADLLEDEDKEALHWQDYMTVVCGYEYDGTNTQLKLNTFAEDAEYDNTREALFEVSGGAIRTYEEGRCYYSWWIRHSNDGDDTRNGTMEYSIVRNNVYKLTLVSVYSLGGDVPEEGLQIRVYVKDWDILDTETVDL